MKKILMMTVMLGLSCGAHAESAALNSLAKASPEAADIKIPPVPAPARNAAAPAGKTGGTHETRCVTLDNNYQPTGGEFFVKAEKGARKASVQITRNDTYVSILWPSANGNKIESEDFSFTVCKKNDSADFAASYEFCGINASFGHGSLIIDARFDLGREIPSFREQLSFSDYRENISDPAHIPAKLLRLETESGAVGHILAYTNGRLDYEKTVRLQCDSLSDNSIVIPGANH